MLKPGVAVTVVAVAALATAGVLFAQRSFHSGLGAPPAVSTIANPVTAAAIGIVLPGCHPGSRGSTRGNP